MLRANHGAGIDIYPPRLARQSAEGQQAPGLEPTSSGTRSHHSFELRLRIRAHQSSLENLKLRTLREKRPPRSLGAACDRILPSRNVSDHSPRRALPIILPGKKASRIEFAVVVSTVVARSRGEMDGSAIRSCSAAVQPPNKAEW